MAKRGGTSIKNQQYIERLELWLTAAANLSGPVGQVLYGFELALVALTPLGQPGPTLAQLTRLAGAADRSLAFWLRMRWPNKSWQADVERREAEREVHL